MKGFSVTCKNFQFIFMKNSVAWCLTYPYTSISSGQQVWCATYVLCQQDGPSGCQFLQLHGHDQIDAGSHSLQYVPVDCVEKRKFDAIRMSMGPGKVQKTLRQDLLRRRSSPRKKLVLSQVNKVIPTSFPIFGFALILLDRV